jgi:hypothetical protein
MGPGVDRCGVGRGSDYRQLAWTRRDGQTESSVTSWPLGRTRAHRHAYSERRLNGEIVVKVPRGGDATGVVVAGWRRISARSGVGPGA